MKSTVGLHLLELWQAPLVYSFLARILALIKRGLTSDCQLVTKLYQVFHGA